MAGILGISIGTRIIGLAVVRDGDLVDYRIKTFNTQWGDAKGVKIFKAIRVYAIRYGISGIVIKTPPEHCTGNTSELLKLIHTLQIPITLCTIRDLKERYTKERASKDVFMVSLVKRYPELSQVYKRERSNRNPYHTKLFEAIECAFIETGQ